MSLVDSVAAIMFIGIIAYAVFAGADFGSGVWHLTAGGGTRGRRMRRLIDHSIGPVWEANHVWLVYVLVFMWTGFPSAFAAICETLFIPLTLAGFGIVVRGSAFAFRKFARSDAEARLFGALFAFSSIATPFLFGAIVGAVASGRVPLDGAGDRWTSWTGPASLAAGVLAVLAGAFLAAVFLTQEATRHFDTDLQAAFRSRSLWTGCATGVVALVGFLPLRDEAPFLFDRLTGRVLPVVLISGAAGLATLFALWRRRADAARLTAVLAVASIVVGWGLGQHPWILVDTARIDDVAGNRATLWSLVGVFALAGVTVVPSLLYLFWLTQRPYWVGDHDGNGAPPATPDP